MSAHKNEDSKYQDGKGHIIGTENDPIDTSLGDFGMAADASRINNRYGMKQGDKSRYRGVSYARNQFSNYHVCEPEELKGSYTNVHQLQAAIDSYLDKLG